METSLALLSLAVLCTRYMGASVPLLSLALAVMPHQQFVNISLLYLSHFLLFSFFFLLSISPGADLKLFINSIVILVLDSKLVIFFNFFRARLSLLVMERSCYRPCRLFVQSHCLRPAIQQSGLPRRQCGPC